LRCYTIASVPRSETARRALMQNHDDIEALYARGADALIVTGTEPRADALEQEPYWQDSRGSSIGRGPTRSGLFGPALPRMPPCNVSMESNVVAPVKRSAASFPAK